MIRSLLLLPLLLAGCSAIPSADVRVEGTAALEARDPAAAIPSVIGLAPVTIEVIGGEVDDYKPAEVAERADLRAAIGDWLERSRVILEARPIDPERDESTDDAAWRQGADLILETAVTGFKVRFKDHPWAYYPNLVNWFLFMVPAWWVASEEYELELEATVSVRLVDERLPLRQAQVTASASGRFDELDRGWNLAGLGMVFSPSLNGGYNWQRVAEKLLPAARSKLGQAVAQELEANLRPVTETETYDRQARRTLALVVGLGNYQQAAALPPNPEALAGAEAVAEALRRRDGERYVVLLRDAEATEARILAAIDAHLVGRSRAKDTVLLFLAGRCVALGGGPALAAYDSDPEGRRLLTPGRLAEALAKAPGRAALMVEAALPEDLAELDAGAAFAPLTRAGVSVVLSASPGQRLVSTGYGLGLFAYHSAEALGGKADLDRDGQVSLDEVGRYVDRRVASDAGFRGNAQDPWVAIARRD